ncbi:hypothetical protein GCM10027610_034950 [Dactylosporangium cerinum]
MVVAGGAGAATGARPESDDVLVHAARARLIATTATPLRLRRFIGAAPLARMLGAVRPGMPEPDGSCW